MATATRVLIADDEITSRILLEETLREWGYGVDVASDGAEAWELLQCDDPPRLVVLDWMMPGMSGPELCRRIKSVENGQYTYAILLTSKASKDDVVKGLEAGADDFLTKPVDPNELKSRLEVGQRFLQYEAALAEKNEQLHTLIEAMPDLVCFKDSEGRILEINEAFVNLLGATRESCLGHTISEAAVPGSPIVENLPAHEKLDEAAYVEGKATNSEECVSISGEGIRTLDVIRVPLLRSDGAHKGLIYLARDVSERKELEEKLRQEATYDVLTGLTTRRHFMERLRAALSASKRHKHPLSLCVCDVDSFKSVNDTYGHNAGDSVLSRIGESIRVELRTSDIGGRYGGDEFCLIFPDTDGEQAELAAERIRERVAKLTFHVEGGGTFTVSTSIGIVEYDGRDITETQFFEMGDIALYEAKRKGRNRVCRIQPPAA